jgi:tRNA-splicing ligase RtcB (3'-phosphate/5'-hydroxy nucleic acid ligase)
MSYGTYEVFDGVIPVWGGTDEKTLNQIRRTLATGASKVALTADNHLGYGVPIGGVAAYKNAISPTGVGFDIACGNKAVLTDMLGTDLRRNIKPIMDDIWRIISFGVGRKNEERVDHELFESESWKVNRTVWNLKQKAQVQLGTVGSGNHYVDLFTDEYDRVWIGVHFGSRGFGHGVASFFLKELNAPDGMEVDPVVVSLDTQLGADYITAMELAGEYAYAGRDWVVDRVRRILGAGEIKSVHNHHNFAWKEIHSGEVYWVVRKGATPAFPGQLGFVGGTMTEPAVILSGLDSAENALGLYSTVHGAGRVMGRKEATGVIKRNKETGEKRVVREPKVTQEMMDGAVAAAGIELRGAGVDESPFVYKRLPDVLAAHSASVIVHHHLKPVGVAMAGKNEFDPYRD